MFCAWDNIRKAKKARKASDIFWERIEMPEVKNNADRRKYSRIIYYKMK